MEPPSLALLVVAALAALIAASSPRLSLVLLFGVSLVFNPSIRLGFVSLYLINVALCLFFVATLVRNVADRSVAPHSSRLDLAVGLFLALLLLTYVLHGGGTGATKRLLAILLFFLGYAAAAQYCHDAEGFWSLASWIGGSAAIAGTFGLYTYLFSPYLGSTERAYGALGNPNGLANYLTITLPFSLWLAWRTPRGWKRLIAGVGPVAAGVGLIATGSRGGVLALLALPVAAGALLSGRRAAAALVLVVTLLAAHLSLVILQRQASPIFDLAHYLSISGTIMRRDRIFLWETPGGVLSFDEPVWDDLDQDKPLPQSFAARAVLWGQAIEAFHSSPLTGTGLGSSQFSGVPYDSKTFDGAFNIWLSLLAETGLVGALGFVPLNVLALLLAWSGARRQTTLEVRCGYAFLLAAHMGALIHGLVEDPLFAVMSNWLSGMVIGMIAAAPRVLSPLGGTAGPAGQPPPPEPRLLANRRFMGK